MFSESPYLSALIGGVLIGFSASLFLLATGRVTGISGILAGLLIPKAKDWNWRLAFILGLVVGGAVLWGLRPESFQQAYDLPIPLAGIAGLLVGFGTVMGNGCTSGHGVCGLARLSIRSVLATLTFIGAGVLTVTLMKRLGL